MPQNLSSTFAMSCTVTLTHDLSDVVVNIDWISPDGYAFNFTTNGDIVLTSLTPVMTLVNNSVVYTHTLRVNTFQASHVGEYTCRVMINDSIVTRKLAASIQGKDYPLMFYHAYTSFTISIGCLINSQILCKFNVYKKME